MPPVRKGFAGGMPLAVSFALPPAASSAAFAVYLLLLILKNSLRHQLLHAA
jgi:hypothetical protein